MEICLLGSLEVFDDDGGIVAIPGALVRTLLTALALRCGAVVSDDQLVDALWGENPPHRTANALQRQVSRLRVSLGAPDAVARRGSGYALKIDRSAVDVFRFDALAAHGHEAMRNGDAMRACELLAEALALWRGDALADVAYEEFAQPDIARLTAARLHATEVRIDADLSLERNTTLISELEQLVAAHPLREHLRAQLMLALSRSGRPADALHVYRVGREVLAEELGLQPSTELRELEAAILRQERAVVARGSDTITPRPTTNLRSALTTMIGRRLEMDALRPMLREQRLVTLVGPGGVGKSRFALEAARERLASGECEVWMVELAEVTDPEDVIPAIMRTLDLPRGDNAAEDVPRLIDYLRGRAALVVLDNCEHLVAAVARDAKDLLESCPTLQIWATSREGLAVPGEVLWPVPPLALDDAIELFVDRARAVNPRSDLGASAAPLDDTVAEVCTKLDGLPLAIELAAARLRAMPIAELAAGLDDRFRVLKRGARTALPRQQTLRAVVDWSYDLLFDDERLVFDRLSVFRGRCSLAAARVVCADDEISGDDVVELITRLVDKSLVVIEADAVDGHARCHMLQTLVDYGRDRLEESGDATRVYAAHVDYYADFCLRSIAALRGYKQRGWLRAVTGNMTNLRAALDVALSERDAETANSIAGCLGWYWWYTGRGLEASEWLALARSCPGELRDATRARVLAWRVFADWPGLVGWGEAAGGAPRGERSSAALSFEQIDEIAREAVKCYSELPDAQVELAGVEIALSITYSTHGQFGRAAELAAHAESLLSLTYDDPLAMAMCAFAAGRRGFVEDRYDDAEEAFDRSIELCTTQAIDVHCSLALRYAARLAAFRGEHAAAVARIERALAIVQALGLTASVNMLLSDLGESLAALGEFDRARTVLATPLSWAREVAYQRGIAQSLTALALTERRAGEVDRAEQCAREGLEAASQIEHVEAAAYCLAVMGWACDSRGDRRGAWSRYVDALELASGAAVPRACAFALEALAGVALLDHDGDVAARLLGAASAYRRARGAAVGLAFAVGARLDVAGMLAAAADLSGTDEAERAFARGAVDPRGVASAVVAAAR